MYKVTVKRELIKRECTRFFDFEREFERYIDALEYASIVEDRYSRMATAVTSAWSCDTCMITLSPSYHRVFVSVKEVG